MNISGDEVEKIINLYKNNLSLREIGKITKHAVPFISRILKDNKITVVKYNKSLVKKKQNKFKKRKINKTTELKIVNMYNAGIKLSSIISELRLPTSMVLNIIYNKYKLKRRGAAPPVFEAIQKHTNEIIKRYKNGVSLNKLSKLYKVNPWTIEKLLEKNNITIRTKEECSNKHTFNKNFFTTETNELYYFMGFCLADGCISQNKTYKRFTLAIGVHLQDEYILKKFCDWTELSYKNIKYHKTKKFCRITFNDTKMLKNGFIFSKFGFTPNKTYEPTIPKIPKKFIRPFLLGLLDGDGNINYNFEKKYNISLVCNKEIIKWYIAELQKLGYKNKIIEIMPKDKIWGRAIISRKDDVLYLAKLLQINKFDFIFDRKWLDLKNILRK